MSLHEEMASYVDLTVLREVGEETIEVPGPPWRTLDAVSLNVEASQNKRMVEWNNAQSCRDDFKSSEQ